MKILVLTRTNISPPNSYDTASGVIDLDATFIEFKNFVVVAHEDLNCYPSVFFAGLPLLVLLYKTKPLHVIWRLNATIASSILVEDSPYFVSSQSLPSLIHLSYKKHILCSKRNNSLKPRNFQ